MAADAILALNNSTTTKTITIVDEGLTQEGIREVLDKVVAYVQNGGVAIIAGGRLSEHMSRDYAINDYKRFFDAFGLPWEKGTSFYNRCLYKFNDECTLPGGIDMRWWPRNLHLKVVNIKNAQPHDRIFIPNEDAEVERSIFAQPRVDPNLAAVTGDFVGSGYLLYVGDTHWEWESTRIVLGLLQTYRS
ncbi:hypothetical protein BJY01DRAFT_244543 [Aspergillus pseudoustus]|uniref:Uncharacterized protein n=1 Tax=Aspergillus pseudoustus TaxID=1810923 RepID=A0ABR4KJV3_9EURO